MDLKKKEMLQRGTAFFPIQYYYSDTGSPLYNLPVHWHLDYEIIHVLKGNYPIFLNNKECYLKENELCFIRDGILHGDGHKKNGSIYESIVFDPHLLRNPTYAQDRFLNELMEHRIIIQERFTDADTDVYSAALSLFKVMKDEPPGYELLTVGALMNFFGYIRQKKLYTENSEGPEKSKARSGQLKAVINLLQTQYGSRITLDDMAKTAGMSPKYFCRVFREMTNRTPMEYLNSYRIDQACIQLRNSRETLIDIAYNCGFNDFSYFIKTFKRFKGMTPHKYRNFST
ncbi:MAG: AraC family transcriptional regulator [Treponema sp.]|jgi:AraC-like DNA-binding protein|nr:AraC family transcriptional regulator [Treponema sp.]